HQPIYLARAARALHALDRLRAEPGVGAEIQYRADDADPRRVARRWDAPTRADALGPGAVLVARDRQVLHLQRARRRRCEQADVPRRMAGGTALHHPGEQFFRMAQARQAAL